MSEPVYAGLTSKHEGELISCHIDNEKKYHPSSKIHKIHDGSLSKLYHPESYESYHNGKYIAFHDKGTTLVHSSTNNQHDGSLQRQDNDLLYRIKRMEQEITSYRAMMDACKNFEYTESVTRIRQLPITDGKATICMSCNYTCDSNCYVDNVKDCGSMDSNGSCNSCPNKCYWSSHRHSPYRIEQYTVNETRTNLELKNKYNQAKENILRAQENLSKLKYELDRFIPKWSCCGGNQSSIGCINICNKCSKNSKLYPGCIKVWDCCNQNESNKGCKSRYECCYDLNKNSIGCNKRYICCKKSYPDINNLNGCSAKYTCCDNEKESNGCKIKYDCCNKIVVQFDDDPGCQNKWSCCNGDKDSKGCKFKYNCCDKLISDPGDGCILFCSKCNKQATYPGCCQISDDEKDDIDDDDDDEKYDEFDEDDFINDVDETNKAMFRGISNVFNRKNNCIKNINQTTKSLNDIKSLISNNSEISKIIDETINNVTESNKMVENISNSFINNFTQNIDNIISNEDGLNIDKINNKHNESINKQRIEIEKIKRENLKCQMDLIEKKIGLNVALDIKNEIPKLQEIYTNKFKAFYQLKQENLTKINEIKNEIEALKQLKSNEITKGIIDNSRDGQIKSIRQKYNKLIKLKENELNKKQEIFDKDLNELKNESKTAKLNYENKTKELKKYGDLMGIKDDKKLVKFLEKMSDLLPDLQEISLNIEEVDITTKMIKKQVENKLNDKIMIKDRFKDKNEKIGIYDLSPFIELFVNEYGFIFMRDLSCKNKQEYKDDILDNLKINLFIKKNNLNENKENLLNTLKKYCVETKWKEFENILKERRENSIKDLKKIFENKSSISTSKTSITTQQQNWRDILKNKWYLSRTILSSLNEKYSIKTMNDIKNIKPKHLKKFEECKIGEIKRFKWNKKLYFKKTKKKYDKEDELPSMELLFKENDINNDIIFTFQQENIQMSSWKLILNDKEFCKELGMNKKDIKKLKYLCSKLENDYNMKFD